MCVEVHNLDTNETAGTVRELATMLNVDVDLLNECRYGTALLELDACLCQLDVFEACDKAGVHSAHNDVYDIEISKTNE